MKLFLQNSYGRTAEDAKRVFCNAIIGENETAVQTLARIVRLFDERIEKKEIALTYEALLELIICNRFEEMCPPEFVATPRSQEINLSDRMAEKLDLNFKAHSCKNVLRSCHSSHTNKFHTWKKTKTKKNKGGRKNTFIHLGTICTKIQKVTTRGIPGIENSPVVTRTLGRHTQLNLTAVGTRPPDFSHQTILTI